MAYDDPSKIDPDLLRVLHQPQVEVRGSVDDAFVNAMINMLNSVPDGDDPVVVCLTTTGGDAELGRRGALEAQRRRERFPNRRWLFLGQTYVYSAGVTIMSGFPREDRYLSRDAVLLIHERQMKKSIELAGPLTSCEIQIKAALSEIANGIELEQQGFRNLIEGSDITEAEVIEKAATNWYVPAQEALDRGLIAGLI